MLSEHLFAANIVSSHKGDEIALLRAAISILQSVIIVVGNVFCLFQL
jgi:hypothetical protein